MKVLLVGGGGREHALAWKLRQSPLLRELIVAPGNPGTASLCRNVAVRADDVAGLVALAVLEQVDLVVVGPEVALADGIADRLADQSIPCFGPTRAAAQIEWSKTFAKTLMAEAGIPTARFQAFSSGADALGFLDTHPWQEWCVVKADGLHAGKGVVVATTEAELRAAIAALDDGESLVLEEPLEGPEISLLAFVDGRTAVPMIPAQDHKRLHDGDQGPNTGGMGAYAPVPDVGDPADLSRLVIEPVIAALAERGTPFIGVLYAGLMLTAKGPYVIEYNVRWGDPEAQALMPLLETDLLHIINACTSGQLDTAQVHWGRSAALGVVLAAANYPAPARGGDPIILPPIEDDIKVFHAGTALDGETLVTAGGRVLTVVGTGADLGEARERAYAYADAVQFEGMQLRHDIGHYALGHHDG